MAVDDTLLEEPSQPGDYTVRFYRWLRPTVSLGYGQPWRTGLVPAIARREGMAVVRRRTGGRAVLHSGELTYSFAGSTERGPLEGGIQATYSAIADGLVAGFARIGVAAEIVRSRGRREATEPGACFAARALNELVAGGGKLVGSAQRRAGGRALQHGSILLERPDPRAWAVLGDSGPGAAREAVGLFDVVGQRLSLRQLEGALAAGLAARLEVPFFDGELSRRELRGARRRARIYADPAFTQRR
jgi:lipoate-protein ligase A